MATERMNTYSLIYYKPEGADGAEAEHVSSVVKATNQEQAEIKGKADCARNWAGFKFRSAVWVNETKFNAGEVMLCCHQ